MAARHGTRQRYNEGCHCDDCSASNTRYQQGYRQRHAHGDDPAPLSVAAPPVPSEPGPVESGVRAEISDEAGQARPGLAQAALALARVMDNPRAVNQQPAAAKVMATLLEKLHSASARGRRGGLAVVREMSKKG